MKVRPKYTWADEEAAAEEQEDKDGAFLRMNAFGETPKRAERMMNKGDSFDRDNFFKIFSIDLTSLSPCLPASSRRIRYKQSMLMTKLTLESILC